MKRDGETRRTTPAGRPTTPSVRVESPPASSSSSDRERTHTLLSVRCCVDLALFAVSGRRAGYLRRCDVDRCRRRHIARAENALDSAMRRRRPRGERTGRARLGRPWRRVSIDDDKRRGGRVRARGVAHPMSSSKCGDDADGRKNEQIESTKRSSGSARTSTKRAVGRVASRGRSTHDTLTLGGGKRTSPAQPSESECVRPTNQPTKPHPLSTTPKPKPKPKPRPSNRPTWLLLTDWPATRDESRQRRNRCWFVDHRARSRFDLAQCVFDRSTTPDPY